MKKILLSFAALLLCFLAHSQEAKSTGSNAELTVIPMLELAAESSTVDRSSGFNLGNSSLYTMFEGSASEHFSWFIVNHWLSGADTEDLWWPYNCLGYSDTTNWLDFFRADISAGNWVFSLGKDMISTGGMEFDDWDWDIRYGLSSPLWNSLPSYQWGGKAAYTTDSENTEFSLQMTTSPWGERPFSSGLWNYSAMWRGEYGWFSNIWSVSALQYAPHKFDYVFVLGQKADFDSWSLSLDVSNFAGADEDSDFNYHAVKGLSLNGALSFVPSDSFDISLKGVYSSDYKHIGALVNWYPGANEDFRVHAAAVYQPLGDIFTFNIGLTYNFHIHLW